MRGTRVAAHAPQSLARGLAATAAATAAARLVLGLVDAQAASIEVRTIERADRLSSGIFLLHLDEGEAACAAQNDIVLGKHSGRHALVSRLESLGYSFASEDVGEIYQRFSALADKKKNIYDQDLLALIPQNAPAAIAA